MSPDPAGPLHPGPVVCRLCGQDASGVLCGDCEGRFAGLRPRCSRCALPLSQPAQACAGCLSAPPPWTRAVCAHDYGFPWDRLISDFKFRSEPALAARLAQSLTTALQATPQGAEGVRWVLPVPLSRARLRERGYNQAWELARRVASALGLASDATLLQRPVDTAHQATLTRAARQENLRHAFMVDPARQGRVRGLHVALVDDVMTTGTTLAQATKALLQAGAGSVEVWAVARTS